jgi:TIR domain
MGWDLFISYASEDRDEVAVPLAEELEQAGVRVWLDQNELRIGDSLREKIDAGLASSDFGVVILSKDYLAKRWPLRELSGLLAREVDGRPVVLPVWHRLDGKEILSQSPMLADKVAANTRDGIEAVAAKITAVVFDPGRAGRAGTLAGRFSDLLQASAVIGEADPVITAFLRRNRAIIARATGDIRRAGVLADIRLGHHQIHFAAAKVITTSMLWQWQLIMLGPVASPFATASGAQITAAPALARLVGEADAIHRWMSRHIAEAREVLRDVRPDSEMTIVYGLRSQAREHASWLADYNDLQFNSRVRTYNWLLEAAAQVTGDDLGPR